MKGYEWKALTNGNKKNLKKLLHHLYSASKLLDINKKQGAYRICFTIGFQDELCGINDVEIEELTGKGYKEVVDIK